MTFSASYNDMPLYLGYSGMSAKPHRTMACRSRRSSMVLLISYFGHEMQDSEHEMQDREDKMQDSKKEMQERILLNYTYTTHMIAKIRCRIAKKRCRIEY